MTTQPETLNVSPATTYCSELEYLIALQSEESSGPELRRSQRLFQKKQRKATAKDAATTLVCEADVVAATAAAAAPGAGSPQLFDELDGECSQLAQLLPDLNTSKEALNSTLQVEGADCTAYINSLVSKVQSEPVQTPLATHPQPQPAPNNNKVRRPTKRRARSATLSESKRRRSKSQPKDVQTPLKQEPTGLSDAKAPEILQPSSGQQSPVNQMNPTNSSQMYAYQCLNLTQTVLPARYPAHFIHQLPPEPKYDTGTVIPGELHRVSSEGSPRKVCSTPIEAHKKCSPSPPNIASVGSRTPSLSESLAEVFGTKNIRDALNIEPPRTYQVQEFHLPAVAAILGVELERLRDVLVVLQRLAFEHMQPKDELTSIHSSSEEDDESENSHEQ